MSSSCSARSAVCQGRAIVRAAFVLALFGWGVGFYGPPVFLHAVVARTGWPLPLVSAAVSLHFLFGAGVVAGLPWLHRRFGVPATTVGGAGALALGVLGWATAAEPWQLLLAALCTGGGWVPLGAAGIHAIVSPWFSARRPVALAQAYNGASVGGMVFVPLWAALIGRAGFPAAAMLVGLAMLAAVLSIATRELGWRPGGVAPAAGTPAPGSAAAAAPPWRSRAFVTLAAAMALGLFAQIGLIAQLFSLLVPAMGSQGASWAMALATACGMGGRLLAVRGPGAQRGQHVQRDWRRVAAASYAVQAGGTLLLCLVGPAAGWPTVLGMVLFGLGIGNATSLPPLVAQADFAPALVPRVVARCVALAQALYALAPAAFAALLAGSGPGGPGRVAGTQGFFAAVALVQGLALACMLAGRRQSKFIVSDDGQTGPHG
ncbi:MAG TPA: MFS transporter [Pseudorhodoferax sp.]|nr:MFS transporter [Pseudorhodoferax sp.]